MTSSVEDNLSDLYDRFMKTHPLKSVMVSEMQQWSFIDTCMGKETILLLPGFMGEASTAFLYILALEANFRVISLSFPASVGQVDTLSDGLAMLMDSLDVSQGTVLGGSTSGFIAQAFVRRYPRRVSRLILTHTGLPRSARARTAKRYMRILDVLPFSLFRWLALASLFIYFPRSQPLHVFWRAHFREILRCQSREALWNRFALMDDFHSHYRFQPTDLTGWHGKIFILEMVKDHLTTPAERIAMRELYPDASVCVLSETAHYDSVERPAEQIDAIKNFLLNP